MANHLCEPPTQRRSVGGLRGHHQLTCSRRYRSTKNTWSTAIFLNQHLHRKKYRPRLALHVRPRLFTRVLRESRCNHGRGVTNKGSREEEPRQTSAQRSALRDETMAASKKASGNGDPPQPDASGHAEVLHETLTRIEERAGQIFSTFTISSEDTMTKAMLWDKRTWSSTRTVSNTKYPECRKCGSWDRCSGTRQT